MKQNLEEIAAIIYRKKSGIDCTEDESATIKMFLKADIEAYKNNYNDLSTTYGILWELFPIECSEAVNESELTTPVKETEQPEQPYYKGKGEHSVNQLEAICSQYKEYVSFLNSRGNDTTPTSKEGLTYKVECLDNSTAHYTHDKKEAYEVYAKFIIDFGDTIRLYEAPMPINDHDEIDWETIECYDVDENESKEGLEDGGFTKGEIFLDEGDFDRNGTPDELYIRGRLNDETFDICNFGCNDTGFALDYATALVARYNQASTLYKENKEQIDLLKWVVNEIETTPDELSDALLGMIKIKCNQLFTRINKH